MKNNSMVVVSILLGLCLMGCEQKIISKVCHYCDGTIHAHKTSETWRETTYKLQYERDGDKTYHMWCYKMIDK